MAIGGNVSIRFTTENAEAVRQALQALGKDGEKALRQMEAAGQPASRSLNALSAVVDNLRGTAVGFAFSLGPVGSGLLALGPAGLAAAAAVGGLMAVFDAAAERADAFAQKTKALKSAADTTGLSIEQIRAVGSAGVKAGLDFEQTTNYLERLVVGVEELRHGSGRLFDALMRIDSGLVHQIASARTTAEAMDILQRAYGRLGDAGRKAEFDRSIAGKGFIGAGQILEEIGKAGGVEAFAKAAEGAGAKIDKELIDRVTKLKAELDQIKSRTSDLWGVVLTESTLEAQKQSALFWERIARAVVDVDNSLKGKGSGSGWGEWVSNLAPFVFFKDRPNPEGNGPEAQARRSNERLSYGARMAVKPSPWQTETAQERPLRSTAEADLAIMQRWTSLLGDALTPSEQLKVKTLELAAAMEKGGVSVEVKSRALAAFALAQEKASVATRTQLGLASEQEMVAARTRELDDLQTKGFIRNAEERAAAQRLAEKEIRDSYDAQRVRASDTPALTKLSIDADKLRLNLDEGLAGALKGISSDLLDLAKGTKTAGEAFTSFAQRIADAVAQALIMKTVVTPLASGLSAGLSGFFGGGGGGTAAGGSVSALGNVFERGNRRPFALGTVLHHERRFPMANGGIGVAGEAGPEAVMPLRRLRNGRLGVSAEGGGSSQINVIHQVINNHSSAKVSTRDEDDGRGGRRTVTVIDELMASAVSQPGSRSMRAFRQSGYLVSR